MTSSTKPFHKTLLKRVCHQVTSLTHSVNAPCRYTHRFSTPNQHILWIHPINTLYHTLSLTITHYHTLSHPITHYHTLSHLITHYHTLSLTITIYHTLSTSDGRHIGTIAMDKFTRKPFFRLWTWHNMALSSLATQLLLQTLCANQTT